MQKIDIVTVVFAAELELLRLQARSFARHLSSEIVGKVLVVINDVDQAAIACAVEELRQDYGPLAGHLRVIQPEELITSPVGMRRKIMRWRMMRGRRKGSGWRGFGGWHVQQFLKLLAVRAASCDYLLIVDAKNWLVKDAAWDDFVDQQGRARTYRVSPHEKQWDWVLGSYKALGLRPPDTVTDVTPTVTPVVYEREWMSAAIKFLESRLGPLEEYFTMRKKAATEFMLLHAYSEAICGGFQAVFGSGLVPPVTIFSTAPHEWVEHSFEQVAAGDCTFFGIHRRKYASLTEDQVNTLCDIWHRAGIVSGLSEGRSIFARLAATSAELERQGDVHPAMLKKN